MKHCFLIYAYGILAILEFTSKLISTFYTFQCRVLVPHEITPVAVIGWYDGLLSDVSDGMIRSTTASVRGLCTLQFCYHGVSVSIFYYKSLAWLNLLRDVSPSDQVPWL